MGDPERQRGRRPAASVVHVGMGWKEAWQGRDLRKMATPDTRGPLHV